MARNQNTGRLIVMEYGGTARSGKGSIVRHLDQTHKGVVSDETGADYRTVAKHLLVEQKVREGMPGASISTIAAGLGERVLTDVVARRREIIDAHSFDSLYERDVSMVVPHVARV
ncbi:MAG TPA: hypothetical protein VLA92_01440, partial [Candidatus Saccharimonadales bacterium]|nr:hypothetical protein [Candidatus Saccharimonadales bacterium]